MRICRMATSVMALTMPLRNLEWLSKQGYWESTRCALCRRRIRCRSLISISRCGRVIHVISRPFSQQTLMATRKENAISLLWRPSLVMEYWTRMVKHISKNYSSNRLRAYYLTGCLIFKDFTASWPNRPSTGTISLISDYSQSMLKMPSIKQILASVLVIRLIYRYILYRHPFMCYHQIRFIGPISSVYSRHSHGLRMCFTFSWTRAFLDWWECPYRSMAHPSTR